MQWTLTYRQEMTVGREVKHFEGRTLAELHVKTTAAAKEYLTMGFFPRLGDPVFTHTARDVDPGYVLRPRPELNPSVYQGRVSFFIYRH